MVMNWYRGDGYGWMDGGAMLVMGLFWILLVGIAVWLIMRSTGKEKASPVQETPRQILDRRFASGEIDADAYRQARKLIEGKITDVGEGI